MKKISWIALVAVSVAGIFLLSSQNTNEIRTSSGFILPTHTDSSEWIDSTSFNSDLIIRNRDSLTKEMELIKLDVRTQIVGIMASTEVEFVFSNPNSTELEGEFYFPLGEGKTITRLAMDINGKLREGVVVGKEKGRIAFESTVRQKIDPALLEWTKGNNFKARVFPIPANGTKRIIIAFEQSLLQFGSESIYFLNLGFKNPIPNFSYQSIVNTRIPPTMKYNKFTDLILSRENDIYSGKVEKKNYTPNQRISIEIPREEEKIVFTQESNQTNYFSGTVFPVLHKKEKEKPKKIAVYWDVSHSGYESDKTKEIAFLTSYLKSFSRKVMVDLIPFHIYKEEKKSFKIKNGNSEELISYINQLNYDGGTNFENLDFKNSEWDEIILVTDGVSTYGNKFPETVAKPIYSISSSKVADFDKLNAISTQSGGVFINLNLVTNKNAVSLMNNSLYRLMKVEVLSGEVQEVFPKTTIVKSSSITLSGKLISERATLKLSFGIGNKILYNTSLVVRPNPVNGLIKNKWAQQKLDFLSIESKKNEEEITKHAKDYKLVTPYTSLIILDRLEDYLQHDIVPPIEMQKEYFAKQTKKENNKKAAEQVHLENVRNAFEQRVTWWNTKFKLPKPKVKKPVIIDTIVDGTDSNNVAISGERTVMYDTISLTTHLIGATSITRGDVNDGTTDNAVSDVPLPPPPPPTPDDFMRVNDEATDNVGIDIENSIEEVDALRINYSTTTSHSFSVSDVNNGTFSHDLNPHSQLAPTVVAKSDEIYVRNNIIEDKKEITLKKWSSKATYIKSLKKEENENLFKAYMELKKENNTSPSFYLDVCTYFQEKNKLQLAERILSNLAELEGENHELLRGLANKLQDLKQQQKAVEILEEVKELRKEEPQSYRDLGLAYAKNNQPQKAIEALYKIVTTKWSRFTNIEQIAINEMNQVIDANPDVNTDFIDSALLKHLPVDMRVVLNWDADATDIDLWVTDPTGEKCFYSHNRTKIGGFMTNDFTQGYGPEVFMIKRGMKGKYKIEANYYGNNSTKTLGPVTLKMQFFTNYGKPNQKVKEVILRLKDSKEVVEIAEIGI